MKQKLILFISLLLAFASCGNPKVEQDALPQKTASFRTDVPLDSIILSDPCILADAKTRQYYMTGTGGLLWKSKDLALWEGPYRVADIDTTSWMGSRPQIWAAELHEYNGKYYYFATFTNNSIAIDTVGNNVIPRRASHVLVSDKAEGPYRPMADPTYLPADKGKTVPNRVTDGPWLFRTDTGRLGMLWTSWIFDVYTQGVAYSESGTLDGSWVQEPQPVTPPNFGHGMLFRDFDGQWMLSAHSHRVDEKGRYIRVPHLFKVDLSGDKLAVDTLSQL